MQNLGVIRARQAQFFCSRSLSGKSEYSHFLSAGNDRQDYQPQRQRRFRQPFDYNSELGINRAILKIHCCANCGMHSDFMFSQRF